MGWVWHGLVSCWVGCSLLSFVFAEEQLEVGDPEECKKADFVPGYNLGGEGFDIVKMERKGSYVIDMEKWDMGNGSCTMQSNSYMNNVKQKIPVAVVFWRTLPMCTMGVSSKTYESGEAVVNDSTSSVSNNWKIGLDLPQVAGMSLGGTHSREAQFSMAKSKEDKVSFTKHLIQCSFYSYQVTTTPPLHPEFLRVVQSLPPKYDHVSYQNFIERFGTHYTTSVELGGNMKAVTAIRTCQAAMNGLSDTAVKDCLDVEASASYSSVTAQVKFGYCNELKKKLGMTENFSSMFNERQTDIVGGNIINGDLFSVNSNPDALSKWMESLQTIPDVVTCSLQPLHNLLSGPAQKYVKLAIEMHIGDNGLKKVCSETCSLGRQSSARDPCTCVCEASESILSNCCPAERGLARLRVFNLRAEGLYGDVITETDGYVVVTYGEVVRRTGTIDNNDNPSWTETFDFGTVKISQSQKLTFEVYDEDLFWVTELLGECSFELRSGTVNDMCVFKYGTFFFSYTIDCGPNLHGSKCAEYTPSPIGANLDKIFDSRNGVLAKSMWKLQAAQNHTNKIYSEGHYGE